EYLIAHTAVDSHPIATDAVWPILLDRAGFQIDTVESDGAIYEIVDADHRAKLESAEQWSKRVALAHQIIQYGIEASGYSPKG
ncbi:MAG: hypothetical protein AAF125_13825, partial [Chloroflexota bacterium]